VTGTKGKGTTSSLIYRMLQSSGRHAFLGGNFGISPLDFLPQLTPKSWVVLELSSFQLFDLRHSPHIAVCLMVVPEHLNWHANFFDYTRAKANLFRHQNPQDYSIFYEPDSESRDIAAHGKGKMIPYFSPPGAHVNDKAIVIDHHIICDVADLKLLGQFNWQNACAAVTAMWQITKDVESMRHVLKTFAGLPHRLEFVRKIEGVKYYDDSFGTTPETCLVALESFEVEEPKIVILGGADKGIPFDDLAKAVKKNNVRKAILIGETAPKIQKALEKVGFTDFVDGGQTMTHIVKVAHTAAKSGDVVLLSPACASFGMFRDYKDRAAQFVKAVLSL
jgi:UDP-N-acetylmuramoylalanine--D-glutamate ligase